MNSNQFQFQQKNASYFRMRARAFLAPCYWSALGISLLHALLSNLSINTNIDVSVGKPGLMWFASLAVMLVLGVGTSVISLFLSAPIRAGYARYNLALADGNRAGVEDLFYCFKGGCYLRTVKLGLLHTLITLVSAIPAVVVIVLLAVVGMAGGSDPSTGWLCLVIALFVLFLIALIPVFIILYRYHFAYYILVEFPDITPTDALRNSASLMKGRKWKLFCLHLSFIGWEMLGVLSCGIGILFVSPYIAAADAAFYDEFSQRSKENETEFPSLDPDDYDPNLAQW